MQSRRRWITQEVSVVAINSMGDLLQFKDRRDEYPEAEHPWRETIVEFCDHVKSLPMADALMYYQDRFDDPESDRFIFSELCKRDRFFLLAYMLNRPDIIDEWLYARCREVEAEPNDYLDLWARFHYKSTIITFAGTIQEVLKDPEITIGIFSHVRPIAKAFLTQIKREFEFNDNLKETFPLIFWKNPAREAPKWSEDEGLIVKRKGNPKEATIEAWGVVDGQPTSKHFSLLLYDDLVTDKSVTTPEMIEKTTNQLELSYNLGKPLRENGRKWFAGTRYAFADTYNVIIERGINTRIYPATDNGKFDGRPVFLTNEEWAHILKTTSRYTIACQQLQNPIMGSKQTFKLENLRLYEIRPMILNVYIIVDPANSKKKHSDRTGIAVIGVDAHLNKYLLDGMCHRMSLSERWSAVKNLRQTWLNQPGIQTVKVGYEKYGMQSDIDHFQEMMRLANSYFDIKELNWVLKGQNSNQDRVQRLQPDFDNWRFFIPYTAEIARHIFTLITGQLATVQDGLTKNQQNMMDAGQAYRVARPIKKINEDNRPYDVVKFFIDNDYLLFPGVHVDLMDAMSRIYDMEIAPPLVIVDKNAATGKAVGSIEPAPTPEY